MINERPLTPEQLAAHWGCSANHVRNLIKRGELQAFRLGRLIRIPATSVEEFEGRRLEEPSVPVQPPVGAQPIVLRVPDKQTRLRRAKGKGNPGG